MDIQGIQSDRPWTLWLWPVVFAAVIFAAELLGPRNGDTVEYSFVVPAGRDANQYQYVGSLADLARSQANHYMHENGRVAVHAVAQPLCSIDRHAPWVFPLLDAALFLLLVGLTVRLLRWSQSPGTMLLLSAAIYIYIEPVRTDIAYQVNYLWVTALVTGFLLLFFSHRRVRRRWIWPLLALFGFVTGESNEAFTAGIGLALVVFLMRRHRRRVTLSQLCLAISFAVGFFVNVLAPGNQVRLDSFTVPSTGELVANLLAWNWLFVPLVAVVSWRSRRGTLLVRHRGRVRPRLRAADGGHHLPGRLHGNALGADAHAAGRLAGTAPQPPVAGRHPITVRHPGRQQAQGHRRHAGQVRLPA